MQYPRLAFVLGALGVAIAGATPGCSCSQDDALALRDMSGGVGSGPTLDQGIADRTIDGTNGGADLAGQGCGLVTCASLQAACGKIGDGCGATLDCGSCPAPESCGGGGVPFQCGGSGGCVPRTCAQAGASCGPAGDGCGGVLDCGSCPSGQSCGGGGQASVCGVTIIDGGPGCVPRTCADAGASCGPVADGCGGLLSCGSCTAPESCGAGGTPSRCGRPPCTPLSCAKVGASCGLIGDGCGGTVDCGGCAAPESCGGGGAPYQCGTPACTPRTCAQAGASCGAIGDGCGKILQCGGCPSPEICGGGGVPNVCGGSLPPDGGGSFAQCDGGAVTTLSGTVVAGTDPSLGFGQPDPIYNAVVYIPTSAVPPIATGATCDQCATSQPAVVSAVTGIDGKFTLSNPPVGANVPLVIQLGKWRRVVHVSVNACAANVLPTDQTRLPRNHNEGDIPRLAIDTGNVDVLECVLRKMGIQDSEFVNPALDGSGHPTASGRVQLYEGGYLSKRGAGGAVVSGATPSENLLWGNQTTLDAYDAVLFSCEGGQDDENAADQARVIAYANAGGRVFATHFSYVWLYDVAPFSSTASWAINTASYDQTFTGFIDQSFPKGAALAQWLFQPAVGASTTLGQIPVDVVRNDFSAVNASAPAQTWMSAQTPADPASFPLHYTFNTPVGAPAQNQCGRVVFSDFHVENSSGSQGVVFPKECTAGPLTPQEKLLEFMLFDLTSCVQPDVPTCTPRTCAEQGFSCGLQGDGCGGQIDCGSCPAGQSCGGGGTPGVCGGGCAPRSCAEQGFSCGLQGDGCGGQIDCGSCPAGQSCGGGGTPGVCGGGCTPITCAQQNLACGPAGDGCGGLLDCGSCPPGQSCGGGGTPGQCGAPADMSYVCKPITCADQGLNCGPAGDGCGGLLQCGTCTPPQTCGGGGTPGVCGGTSCTPRTCAEAGASCGLIGDGCGATLDCGSCPTGQVCGGGGVANVCGVIG